MNGRNKRPSTRAPWVSVRASDQTRGCWLSSWRRKDATLCGFIVLLIFVFMFKLIKLYLFDASYQDHVPRNNNRSIEYKSRIRRISPCGVLCKGEGNIRLPLMETKVFSSKKGYL
jgi:hypothetical protein